MQTTEYQPGGLQSGTQEGVFIAGQINSTWTLWRLACNASLVKSRGESEDVFAQAVGVECATKIPEHIIDGAKSSPGGLIDKSFEGQEHPFYYKKEIEMENWSVDWEGGGFQDRTVNRKGKVR